MIVTALFLLLIFLASFFPACSKQSEGSECPSKFGYLVNAAPNEVGDALAGVAGTLAFFWIIVTVMLQSKELAAQRQELKLARKESARMASSLNEQAQAEATRLRHQELALFDQLLEEQLEGIRTCLRGFREFEGYWEVAADKSIGRPKEEIRFVLSEGQGESSRDFIEKQIAHLERIIGILKRAEQRNGIKIKPHRERRYYQLCKRLDEALLTSEKASPAYQQKMELLRTADYLDSIRRFLRENSFWHGTVGESDQ